MQRSMMLIAVSMLATMAAGAPVRVGHMADEFLTVVMRFYPTSQKASPKGGGNCPAGRG
jgi:hypothetical protein